MWFFYSKTPDVLILALGVTMSQFCFWSCDHFSSVFYTSTLFSCKQSIATAKSPFPGPTFSDFFSAENLPLCVYFYLTLRSEKLKHMFIFFPQDRRRRRDGAGERGAGPERAYTVPQPRQRQPVPLPLSI